MEEKRSRGRPKTPIKLHKRTMSFPPTLYERLTEIATREERNVNELIVAVLRDFVRKDEEDKGNTAPMLLAA